MQRRKDFARICQEENVQEISRRLVQLTINHYQMQQEHETIHFIDFSSRFKRTECFCWIGKETVGGFQSLVSMRGEQTIMGGAFRVDRKCFIHFP